jgi:hypothetical protein
MQVVLSLHHPIVSSTATPSSSTRTDVLPPRRHHLSRIRLKKEGIAVARTRRRIAGSAAGRAARAIDPRNPPGFLAAHCGGAAAGACIVLPWVLVGGLIRKEQEEQEWEDELD